MISENILIGADPEIFVYDKKFDTIISAHGLIEGTKHDPLVILNGALQVDGMALEFNINPAQSLKEFLYNINFVTTALRHKIQDINPDLEFQITPVAHFSQEYMDTVPEDAKRLGCEPDFNAYTRKMNTLPDSGSLIRTASGHVHIGWTEAEDPTDKAHFNDCCIVTKQLDAALYSVSPLWDPDTLRRKLYGAKGAFRPKHYGVEYRVLSNRWLVSKPMQAWIYQATQHAMSLLARGDHIYTNDQFSVRSPAFLHEVLVNDYGFPTIPGIQRTI